MSDPRPGNGCGCLGVLFLFWLAASGHVLLALILYAIFYDYD